jgi:hypothetical protein
MMSSKMTQVKAGSGGFFLIGLVFTIVGVSTDNAGFYAPGILFLVIGLGGLFYPKGKSVDSTESDGSE